LDGGQSAYSPRACGRRRTLDEATALPRARDGDLFAILCLVLVLQVATWWLLRGHSEADAVEYVERAQIWVNSSDLARGTTLRPFAYSLLFAPLFAVARWLGLEDLRPLFTLASAMQIALSLVLVVAVARLGARLGGRAAGLAAAFLIGVNPVFLHYSVVPVTGIPAALCLALALGNLLDETSLRPRSAWRAGLWSGAAVMVAYTSLMIVLLLGLCLLLRERWRGRAAWASFGAAVACMLALQLGLDRWIYGEWGASFVPYAISNFGGILSRWLWNLELKSAASWIYTRVQAAQGKDYTPVDPSYEARQVVDKWWYVTNLPRLFVWPVLFFGAAAILSWFARPRWPIAWLSLVLAASVLVMSSKGWKSFRLWLPLLPIAIPLCAAGYAWLRERSGPLMRGVLAALLVAALPLGLRAAPSHRFDIYSDYWNALDLVERSLDQEKSTSEAKPRLACAFDWAIYLRASPRIEVARLPGMLDGWENLDAEQRSVLLESLDSFDWLLVHLPVLTMHPDLMGEINARFEVRGACREPDPRGGRDPVFALHRRTGSGTAKSFFEITSAPLAETGTPLREPRTPLYFTREVPGGGVERITLLRVSTEPLPGTDASWLTYTWRAETPFSRSYRVLARITGPAEIQMWQNPHAFAYGAAPMTGWSSGALVRESFLMIPRQLPPEQEAEIANADVTPADRERGLLCLSIADDSGSRPYPRLELARPGESSPVRLSVPRGALESADGLRWAADGSAWIGVVALPLPGGVVSSHP
jgi:hypothetical protein